MVCLKQSWFQVWNVLLVTPLLRTHCCHHPQDHHTTHHLGCKCHVVQHPPPPLQHTHRVRIQYISKIVVISTWMLYSSIYTCRGHFLIQILNLQTDSKTYNHIGPRITEKLTYAKFQDTCFHEGTSCVSTLSYMFTSINIFFQLLCYGFHQHTQSLALLQVICKRLQLGPTFKVKGVISKE
jgi:hypothetical protein